MLLCIGGFLAAVLWELHQSCTGITKCAARCIDSRPAAAVADTSGKWQ
jgi:hypothetical protein